MKRIVITGSTRGIGFGLADEFLQRQCAVTVSGRSQESVDAALGQLAAKYGKERLHGQPCDVTDLAQVQALWDAAVEHFGGVDIWINNAGIGHPTEPMWELSPEQVAAVLETNVLGTTHGVRVAVEGMEAQGGGQIYNLEGFGSTGRTMPGMSIYGTSKAAITYLTQALIEELQDTPVRMGSISPGMVITDLITDRFEENPETREDARGIFNILADRVEDVTPWMAERVLENESHGKRIAWLTRSRIIWRFLKAPFSKRDVFEP
jgi:NAD(P)-dependent dehydrogenase (short-subunit alcohol dehydrogenase family)